MEMSGKELVKLLKKNGWVVVRIEGSHHIMRKDSETVCVPVRGNKALKPGLISSLLKDVGLK